jgi:guanine deaminase
MLLPGGADWSPRRTDLLAAGGRIAAIGPGLAGPDGAEVLDGAALLLMPAFVNAHTHSPEALARGRAPRARLDAWLTAAYGAGEDALPPDAIAAAIRASAHDAIRSGAVSVTDHFRQIPPNAEAVRAAAEAWRGTGLSARVAVMMRDRASPPGTTPPPGADVLLPLADALLRDPPPGVEIGLGPSAPQRCTDALLAGLAETARRHGAFLHLHCCETAKDAADCRVLYGRSAIAQLAALGVLGPRTELAHCVHVDDADLDLLAATGSVMVHNPVANLRLGSGIAPVARALRRGVRLAIGTDGAGSNDSQDMQEAAKLAFLLPRAALGEEEWPEHGPVLAAATGHAVLATGARADILAFDLAAPAFAGARPAELAPRVLLAARPHDIRHLLASGRFLLRDGTLIVP